MSVGCDERATSNVNMNLKRLISCVYERKCVWDQSDGNYSNKVGLRQAWDDIAKEMDCSADICKQKWRSLRDVFRRELKKYQCRLVDPNALDKSTPRWYYFKDMQFLTHQMLGYDSGAIYDFAAERPDDTFESFYVKNYPPIKRERDSNDEEESVLENSSDNVFFVTELQEGTLEEPNDADNEDADATVTCLQEQQRRRPSSIDGRDERKRRRIEADVEDDSDYHFLMSLLPYLRDVPQSKKMQVRIKIQSVFCEEVAERLGDHS